MPIWEISAKTGEGMDAWLGFLESRLTDSRQERQAAATSNEITRDGV